MDDWTKQKNKSLERRRAELLAKAQRHLREHGVVLQSDGTDNTPHPVLAWSIIQGVWFVPAASLEAYEFAYRNVSLSKGGENKYWQEGEEDSSKQTIGGGNG